MPKETVKFGIDFGTTNSCVAFHKLDKIDILASQSSSQKNTIPTCVSFSHKDGTVVYGDAAINNSKKYSDLNPDILKFYPFVKKGENDDIIFELQYNKKTQNKTPIEIYSLFLQHIKRSSIPTITKSEIDCVEPHAVICIPAVFNHQQREGTKQAAKSAGIEVDELLPEATAAALAYCYSNEINKDVCNILVYDFGGGTFDVSIIHVVNGELSIIASEGDSELGGEDITNRIIEYLIKEIRKKNKDFMKGYENDNKAEDEEESKTELKEERDERTKREESNRKMLKKLRRRSEDAKIYLSDKSVYDIEAIDDDEEDMTFTRSRFEELCEDIFQNTLNTVKRILNHCNLKPKDIDYIVLAGGSSRIPKVQEMLKVFFNGKTACKSINPDEAIAYGAAVYSAKDENSFKYTIKGWDKKQPFSFGIDLGTIFSCTAYYSYSLNTTRIIAPISGGKQSIPSIIAFEKKGDKILYGKSANNASPTKYTIISDSKRYIGKDYSELNEDYIQSKSYKIINKDGIKYKVEYNKSTFYYSPKDISSMILKHIKTESIPTIPETGKDDISTTVYPIVLTVPADFSFIHREQTIAAATEAGFKVTALINEPTAAALAYVEKNDNLINRNPFHLLVYDLGGGTFDVSIVRIESKPKSKCKKIKVFWTDGINNIGGQDFTMELIKHIKQEAGRQFGNEVNLDCEKAIRRIEKDAERIKIDLTESEDATADLDIDDCSYKEKITRSKFNSMIKPYIDQTIEKVKDSIKSSGLNTEDIAAIVLTGGSSHIPLVKDSLKSLEIKIENTINPDEAVAIGACLYAKNLGEKAIEHHEIVDVLSHSLGMEIKRILQGVSVQRMLSRMSELPCEFSTQIVAKQGVAEIKIYEGESNVPSQNTFLGKIEIYVPDKKDKEDASVKVTFKANKDGKLEVSANLCGVNKRINGIFNIR